MASCQLCGRTILFGGKRREDRLYCSANCASHDAEIVLGRAIPEVQVHELVHRWRNEPCPKCRGPGPVDLRSSHKVHSFLFMTQWSSPQLVSCRGCARKQQIGHAFYSLLLGWWGFPWGLVMTPVQIGRNLKGMLGDDAAAGPTPGFEDIVRRTMARQIQAHHEASGSASG